MLLIWQCALKRISMRFGPTLSYSMSWGLSYSQTFCRGLEPWLSIQCHDVHGQAPQPTNSHSVLTCSEISLFELDSGFQAPLPCPAGTGPAMVVLAPAAINKSLPKLIDRCKRRAPLPRNITRGIHGACGQKQPHGPRHAAPKTSEDPRAGIGTRFRSYFPARC